MHPKPSVIKFFAVFNLLLCIVVTASSQQDCTNKYFFNTYSNPGNQPIPTRIIPAKSGGVIVAGNSQKASADDVIDGFLSKVDRDGNIVWIKNNGDADDWYYGLTATMDGNYLAFGTSSSPGASCFLLKFDENGSEIWKKLFNEETLALTFADGDIKEDSDGSILIVTNFVERRLSFSNRILFTRFDVNGNRLNSKIYYDANFSLVGMHGLILKDGFAYLAGSTYDETTYVGLLIKVDKRTGEPVWTKTYNTEGLDFSQIFEFPGNRICLIGQAQKDLRTYYLICDTSGQTLSSIYTKTDDPIQRYHAVAAMDENANLHIGFTYNDANNIPANFVFMTVNPLIGITSSYQLKDISDNQVYGTTINTDGDIIFTGFNKVIDINDTHWMLAKFPRKGLPKCNTLPLKNLTGNNLPMQKNISLVKRDITYATIPATVKIKPTINLIATQLCSYTKTCQSIKLNIKQNSCNTTDTLKLNVLRNPGCESKISWLFDSASVAYFYYPDDTSINLVYKKATQSFIYAKIQSECVKTDSVLISISNTLKPLSLGIDKSICPGQTLLLNASANYLQYLWQDGTKDSILVVKDSGTYWVEVVDACQKKYRDSVKITRPELDFKLPSDITICKYDTITITAPGGFTNYSWSPIYNVKNSNAQSCVAFPEVDTVYKVTASKAGCTVQDSIKIIVFNTPSIMLGNDTSICEGDSIILKTMPGFKSYLWNNGSQGSFLIVKEKGIFYVQAKTDKNCLAKDTISIQMNKKPPVKLNGDSILCQVPKVILNAGAGYKKYLWNTGETTQSIEINNPGFYSVVVTDNNGCKATDSVDIKVIRQPIVGFLPGDSTICLNFSINIMPTGSFKDYLWNTGARTASIAINSPGTYWLKVTDNYNCTSYDTVKITAKQCFEGLYIPSAFTPNGDGLNDVFKPIAGGLLKEYSLTIYNRFGQKVFETNDIMKGWNGIFNGKAEASGAFVWQCRYQFSGLQTKTEKGTVMLLR